MANLNPTGLYCAYLRKSRRDMELEALGQGETLARHEKQLTELAQRLGVQISKWYREIVSGETIAERPQARQLLADVGAGLWDGVLVMDVDRLARGDSIDQGVIMQTLLYAGVLVVTPDKIYDPTDEADAEFFEVKLFFARREYNMIKKRMQRGRIQSVLDGCYLGPDLYGYKRVKLQGRKGWSLEVVPEQAQIVRSIFQWYALGMDGQDVGANNIARRLNEMGLKTARGNAFTPSAVKGILGNPTYAGKIRWNTRTQQFRIVDGKRVRTRPLCDDPILVDGLHEPIVDAELFRRVQTIFASHDKRPKNAMRQLVNPLSGLIVCGECGHLLQAKEDRARQRRDGFLYCPTQGCPTCSAYVFVVEEMVLEFLAGWVRDYEARQAAVAPPPDPGAEARAAAIDQHREQLATLKAQSGRLYDLLEQGLYPVEVHNQRRAELDAKISAAQAAIDTLSVSSGDPRDLGPLIPQIRTVLDAYRTASSSAEKNALLRSVIDRVEYRKTRRLYRNQNLGDHISLAVYPRFPDDGKDK